jgi:hypothetical protein
MAPTCRQCVCEICTCSHHHCPPVSTNSAAFSLKKAEKPAVHREKPSSNPLSMDAKAEWVSESKSQLKGAPVTARAALLPDDLAATRPMTNRAVRPFEGLSEARAQYTPKSVAYQGRAGERAGGLGLADGASSADWTTESKAVFRGQRGDRAGLNLEGFSDPMPSRRVTSKFDGRTEAQAEFINRGVTARAERITRPANPLFGGDKAGDAFTSESRSAFVDKGVVRTRPEWDGAPITKRAACPAIKIVPVGDRKRSVDGHVRFERSASGMNWV